MTALLERAFKRASALPDEVQDALAQEFLQELEWETRWDKTLDESQSALDKLTSRALAEHKAGRTVKMGMDEL